MWIKKALKSLSDSDRKRLMIAFEQQNTHYVKINKAEFIGVNVVDLPNLEILETQGAWSVGRYN